MRSNEAVRRRTAMSPRPAIDHIRKPQILEAAAQVITERGLAATRIADVAARAGTSAPAVLYWFDEPRTAAQRGTDRRRGYVRGRGRPSGSPGLECRRASGCGSLIEATVGDTDMSLWIELWARSLHDPAAAAARAAARRRLARDARRRIARGPGDGRVRRRSAIPARCRLLARLADGRPRRAGDPRRSRGRAANGCCELVIDAAEALLGAELPDSRSTATIASRS